MAMSTPRFRFPVHDTQDYKGRILFKAFKENYKTLQNTVWDAALSLDEAFESQDWKQVGTNQNNVEQAFRGNSNATRTAASNQPEVIRQGHVQLFLPTTLRFADAAEYTNVDLGMVGAGVAAGIRSGENAGDLARRVMSSALPSLESLQDAVVNGLKSEAAQVAALRTAGKLSEGIKGAIETETGITLNPNRRSTFRGIGIRRFRFSFTLIPNSAEEAQQIKRIIQWLRLQMYPEERSIAALAFPSKFNIELLYGSKQVGMGILPCFLESLDVTLNPNAMAFHVDGEPQETVISLSFMEERALTKADIVDDIARQRLTGIN